MGKRKHGITLSLTPCVYVLTGYSEVNSKDIHDNPNLAQGYSSKSDFYYICIRAYANADGGYITLRVENKEPS
ncbi:MAG TPA: hypothetical protein VJ903_05800 [Clostridia bacterium]|nr:hypothetical protein [Clostridia bacterium]